MTILALALLLAAPPSAELKRARDRYEFGAYADAAGAVRELLASRPDLPEPDLVEAWKLLGLAEYQLGDQARAREAFVNLLSLEPEYALDAFLVPPKIVEFFDQVKRDNEAQLAPLRQARQQLREQQRAADEAKRRLLAEEQARAGPPTKTVRVQDRIYLFNWLPLGAGQFQNGENFKGTTIAVAEVLLAATNLGAIVIHNQIADDRSRRCTLQSTANCSNPPITDTDRALLSRIDMVKYVSAGLFWMVYAYGVVDAHLHYVPRIETEISPGRPGGALKLSWSF